MTRFVKKFAGAYNINKSTRRSLRVNVKLIIQKKIILRSLITFQLYFIVILNSTLQLEARKLAHFSVLNHGAISVVHLTGRKRNAFVSSFSTYRGYREPLGSLEAVLNFQ